MSGSVFVDTGIWIDYFHGRRDWRADRVHRLISEEAIATGDYVIHELLRGVRSTSELMIVRDTIAAVPSEPMLGDARAVRSAMRYRELRQRGITVRKPNDATIASYCIDEGLPLLTADRDFLPYAEHLGLHLLAE